MEDLVPLIAEVILSYNDAPYVIFGHCMGGFMAHEVTRYIISKKDCCQVQYLFPEKTLPIFLIEETYILCRMMNFFRR